MRIHRNRMFLAAATLVALALPAAVWAMANQAPAAGWTAPTPEEGESLTTPVGEELVFALAASAPGAPAVTVTIGEEGLPLGAELETVAGNPATATVRWIPAADQAGLTFDVTFTAQTNAPALGPAVRNVKLVAVKPAPRAKPRPKKVTLCYRRKTVRVKKAAVKRFLKRGAKRGRCKAKTRKSG